MTQNQNESAHRDVEIEKLELNYGEFVRLTIVVTKNKVTYRESVHLSFGDDFPAERSFEEEIEITPEQFASLSDMLHDAGLLEVLRDQSTDQSLSCDFDDGAHYEYQTSGSLSEKFEQIARLLISFCDTKRREDTTQQIYRNDSISRAHATRCCGAAVLNGWEFCPQCGKPAELDNERDAEYDIDETSWFCSNCGESIPMRYKYCGRCGHSRSW